MKAKVVFLTNQYWYKYLFYCPDKKIYLDIEKNISTGRDRVYFRTKYLTDCEFKARLECAKKKFKIVFLLRAKLSEKMFDYLIESACFLVWMSASWGLMYSTLVDKKYTAGKLSNIYKKGVKNVY